MFKLRIALTLLFITLVILAKVGVFSDKEPQGAINFRELSGIENAEKIKFLLDGGSYEAPEKK